ncbi:nucleolar and coiled-body phosphoprotein 1-like [Macrobrachium rosenbergii]|uniref:nucleolar and coiled-body phosphoprotein 1-like n=1 Tax=Macrobrachium rosenbergii TaxID=79674 RepID=UPI0034D474B9
MRVTPLKVNPQNEIHFPAKEISISPRKTSSQKKISNSPQKVSPQKRMGVSPKKVSPQKRMIVSPKKASPQKRMSVSPKKASPQKRMIVSPKKASPQKRMSVSPKKASPQKSMSVSPKKASPQKRMSVSPQKASPQKRLSVSPKKASPQKRMNVSPKKASPQKRMSVSPKKASHQKRMSVSSRKASPQQRMSVSPRKVSPQKRMSVSPRKVNPQNKLIVSPNKANSQKRISVSAKKATPQKRINVTPEKSSPKKKMSDFPKGTSSQMEFIESPLKGTPQNRKHDFLEAGSTHTASAKIASPQKRRKIHSQQEFSPASDGSPPRKLRNSSREVRVLEKTEKSYASAVSGAKGDDESVLENGGFEMGVNLEMPSSDSTSTHKDTLESSEKTLVENTEESLERQGLLEEFTETPRKLNLSENISKNEGLEREGNPDNASLVQITSQEDTQASVEKTDVENSVESPGKPSLHKRYSGISMKLSMSESRSDTSLGIDEEISISSERRSSSRKRNSKKYFGTDDITSSVRDVSLKKSDKDNINISTSKKKSSEGIALKRKISDTSFVHGELFLGDKNEQGSGKRRRRNSLKRRRSSSREDERGLKSIVHEVLVHPEEAIKAMRKSNYLLGDKNANEDLGSEHAIELQEEDVGKARGSNTGTERTVKNNSSTVNNSVVTQKHVEDQRERSDKLNSVPQSDNSGAVIADTQEDNGETEGDTTSSDKYIEDTPVTRSVEVEGGKDQREENIDRETLEVEEETGKDTQSDNTVIGDVFLDGRSTKEDINEESYAASSDSKDQKSNSHVNDNVVPGVTVSGGLSSSVEAEGVRQVGNENEIDITSSQDDELSEFQVRKLAIDVEGGESSGDEELSMNLIPISFQRRNEKARIQKENITLTQQEEKVMSPERETSERSSAGSDPKQPSETPKLIQMTMTNFLTKLAANPPRQSALYDVKESKDFVEAMFRGIERPQANQTKRLNIKTKQARKEKLPLSVPESMTKEIFEHYAKCKVDKNALKTIVKISEKFWGNCAEDLMSIAKSRGERFVITKEDVIRLMTREGTISESTPLTSLIMEYLPSEEWDILIPTEYGHNRIYPPPEK